MRLLLLFCTALLSAPARAQYLAPDSTLSSDRLLTYTFANDAPLRTDYYFTQGMSLNVVLPALRHMPLNGLLLRGPAGHTQYHGIKIYYDGFTPLRIQDSFIRYGDRPYAAYIYAAFYRAANSPVRRQRLTSAINLGYIGPGAGAKGFQTTLHKWLDSPTPRGWDYQIQHDLVLGYELAYERQLAAIGSGAELIGRAAASASTLHTYASTGAKLRLGLMNPYFANLGLSGRPNRTNLRRVQLYAQAQAEGRLVGYNATLQGGLLNRRNPYTLSGAQVSRGVLRTTYGLVAAYAGVSLEANIVNITPEFAGGRPHGWLQLGVSVAF